MEVVKHIDNWNLPQHNEAQGIMTHGVAPSLHGIAAIFDYVLNQPKLRGFFRDIQKLHADQLMAATLSSIRRPNNFACVVTKEVLTRLIAHICFCKGDQIANEHITAVIKLMNTLAFTYSPSQPAQELSKEQLSARNQA